MTDPLEGVPDLGTMMFAALLRQLLEPPADPWQWLRDWQPGPGTMVQ